jgi:peroxiredoxin
LQAYQAIVAELSDAGASLVAISPMLPDGSLSAVERNDLEFKVLSDRGNAVARAYGLVFRLPEEIRVLYEGPMKILLPEVNGDESWTLPVPGTFVVGRDGIVRWRFIDPDHTRRAEPADVIAVVRTLTQPDPRAPS